ncbi:MAG: hypothetical protein KatS3mg104_0767 [Phycisphaerae bacterium]|nr:MAG: hypothetical protein KatS3mg104_0767 [Phycisphaerae bacterium]
MNGSLAIRNQQISAIVPDGTAGIYRPLDFSGPVQVTATLKEMNGFNGRFRRYDHSLLVRNNGSLNTGYGLHFTRGDDHFSDSAIRVVDGVTEVASVSIPLQFGSSIRVSATFESNGRISGRIDSGGGSHDFSFGPRSVVSSGSNFAYQSSFADGRADSYTFARMDDVSLSTAPAPPAPPTRAVPTPMPPREGAKNLILVTHGWRGGGEDSASAVQRMVHALSDHVDTSEWQIVPYDWSSDADTVSPGVAGTRAIGIGRQRGLEIVAAGYEKVHLIGHSAGSWLIDGIADQLNKETEVQLTFLDAYVPNGHALLGDTADWAEHYVDNRLVPGTNETLTHAFNVDVTELDVRDLSVNPKTRVEQVHGWPVEWYIDSIRTPSGTGSTAYGFGHALAIEATGHLPSEAVYPANVRVSLPVDAASSSAIVHGATLLVEAPASQQAEVATVWHAPVALSMLTQQVSSLDDVTFPTDEAVELNTTSSAWMSGLLEVSEPANMLSMRTILPAGADGILTVYLDEVLVAELDPTVLFGEYYVTYLGFDLIPGIHSLALRLDSPTGFETSVEISQFQLGMIPEPTSLLGAWLLAWYPSARRRRVANF